MVNVARTSNGDVASGALPGPAETAHTEDDAVREVVGGMGAESPGATNAWHDDAPPHEGTGATGG